MVDTFHPPVYKPVYGNGTFPNLADPFTQPVLFLQPDGQPFNVTVDNLAAMHFWGVDMGILYGVATGLSAITLIVYALLINPKKRRHPIYILNMLALVFNLVKSVVQCVYVAGPFQNPYSYFAYDYSNVPPSAYANSVIGAVVKVLQLSCLEASLITQVNIILITSPRFLRQIVVASSMLVAFIAVTFSFALMVLNCKAITSLATGYPFIWLTAATSITTTISICYFSVILTAKLGYALLQRRHFPDSVRRQFGPLQVLFIMSFQTMFVPAVFSIAQNWSGIDDLYTMTLCLACIMLPLSSLWAQALLRDRNEPMTFPQSVQARPLIGVYGSGSAVSCCDLSSEGGKAVSSGKSRDVSTISSGMSSAVGPEKDVEMQTNNINIIIP